MARRQNAKLKEQARSAPHNAQGDVDLLTFTLDVASNPAMIRAYLNALLFGLDAIVRKSRGEDAPKPEQPENPDGQKTLDMSTGPRLDVKVLNREIVLPATTAFISEFVKTIAD